MSYEKATIMSFLRKIHEKELVLPAIQRDFVWDEEQIYRLLDSILRNYPFGTLLFWNTKQRVQYREFTLEWSQDERFTYNIKPDGHKSTLVLDGQQRLQSLYLAIYGSLENRLLHFDLLSGDTPDDISQAKYLFQFLTGIQAEKENAINSGKVYWVPLREIANLENHGHMTAKVQQYLRILNLDAASAEGTRLSNNVSTAYHTLKSDPSLNFYMVDKEYGDDGVITSQDEILEIFVRVNSGGQVLSKSDLMFSLLQLSWEGAADAISDLVAKLNKKGRYKFDKDFVLKCALVCVDEGAKYEVAKFRDETTIKKIEAIFSKLDRALVNCADFIVDTSRLLDERILRSYNTLIPFVYFFFLQQNQDIRGEQTRIQMNQALYLSLMTTVYSRLADPYIDQVVNNVFKPFHKTNPGIFPLEQYRRFIYDKRERASIDDWLLQNNLPLLMNILENGRILPEGRRARVPEYDHIFPKSKLVNYGYSDDLINHYANMRLIPAKDNNWKRDKDPKPYFDANPDVLGYYLIPAGLLKYEDYTEFLNKRKGMIWDRVKIFLGLPEDYDQTAPSLPPSIKYSAIKLASLKAKTGGEIVDEITHIRKVLHRKPLSNGQKALFSILYNSIDQPINSRDLAKALSFTPIQFAGLMGALGKRIEGTEGSEAFPRLGIGLFFEFQRSEGQIAYKLRPIVRQIFEEDGLINTNLQII